MDYINKRHEQIPYKRTWCNVQWIDQYRDLRPKSRPRIDGKMLNERRRRLIYLKLFISKNNVSKNDHYIYISVLKN